MPVNSNIIIFFLVSRVGSDIRHQSDIKQTLESASDLRLRQGRTLSHTSRCTWPRIAG